jgi:hypothetical protein
MGDGRPLPGAADAFEQLAVHGRAHLIGDGGTEPVQQDVEHVGAQERLPERSAAVRAGFHQGEDLVRRAFPFLAQRIELVVVGERLDFELVVEGQQLRECILAIQRLQRCRDAVAPMRIVIPHAVDREDDVLGHRVPSPRKL